MAFSKWYAWLGWCYLSGAEGPWGNGHDQEYMQDHLKFPELAFMENFYFVPIWTCHAVAYAYGGAPWAVYVSMCSGCLCQVLTLYFNVIFHSHPAPTTEKEKKAFANPEVRVCRGLGRVVRTIERLGTRGRSRRRRELRLATPSVDSVQSSSPKRT